MRESAIARHDANAAELHRRVRGVLECIHREVEMNNGVYPHNEGAVSLAEVARRTGIHPVTFHKPRYRTLVQEVREWLRALKGRSAIGKERAKKSQQTRNAEWKRLYEDLLEAHCISEVDLVRITAELAECKKTMEKLRAQLRECMGELSGVIRLVNPK